MDSIEGEKGNAFIHNFKVPSEHVTIHLCYLLPFNHFLLNSNEYKDLKYKSHTADEI